MVSFLPPEPIAIEKWNEKHMNCNWCQQSETYDSELIVQRANALKPAEKEIASFGAEKWTFSAIKRCRKMLFCTDGGRIPKLWFARDVIGIHPTTFSLLTTAHSTWQLERATANPLKSLLKLSHWIIHQGGKRNAMRSLSGSVAKPECTEKCQFPLGGLNLICFKSG